MQLNDQYLHAWDLSPKDAIKLQKQLAGEIRSIDELSTIKTVAGIDVGFENNGDITRAAICVLKFPSLEPIEYKIAKQPTCFPYVPGLLSFREIPTIIEALSLLQINPDLLFCDGQGLAHPRRFGIACHLGLITNIPSIGVGKSKLVGQHDEVANEKGAWVKLYDKQECIGAVLRTRINVKPVYISVGHKVSLETAVEYVMKTTTRYKLPETTRLADKLASRRFSKKNGLFD